MEARLLEIRRATYRLFVEAGRAPSRSDVAQAVSGTADEIALGWRALHDEHAFVLDGAGEIRMANPFSAVPTPYTVRVQGRSWFANCAWDAFGICAALHSDGAIETACSDCGEPLTVEVADERPSRTDLLFHCLVPARQWWDDIVFT